jgi:acyl carrier protein
MDELSVNRMRVIVSKLLDVEETSVTMSASFLEDLGADSLDIVSLCMEIEDAFGVAIPQQDYEQMVTVGKAVAYLDRRLTGVA